MGSFERVWKEILRISWAVSNLFFCLLSDLFFFIILIQLLRLVKIVFPCSGICCLCFALCEIIRFRHYFGDPYSFSKRQQHTFCFFYGKGKNNTNDWFLCDTLLIETVWEFQQIWFLFHFKNLFKFEPLRLSIFLYWWSIYKVGLTYWLSLTLDYSPDKWINHFCSSSIICYTFLYH